MSTQPSFAPTAATERGRALVTGTAAGGAGPRQALGMIAAVRQNSWADAGAMSLAYVGASMPVYWLGLILILLFSFTLNWLPPAGADDWRSLVMPAVTLGFVSAGLISRLVRSSMIEVLAEDYIRTSRAKGLTERLVLWRHGLKNALLPVITAFPFFSVPRGARCRHLTEPLVFPLVL